MSAFEWTETSHNRVGIVVWSRSRRPQDRGRHPWHLGTVSHKFRGFHPWPCAPGSTKVATRLLHRCILNRIVRQPTVYAYVQRWIRKCTIHLPRTVEFQFSGRSFQPACQVTIFDTIRLLYSLCERGFQLKPTTYFVMRISYFLLKVDFILWNGVFFYWSWQRYDENYPGV